MAKAEKTIKVTEDIRTMIDRESAETRLPMYRLIEIAWDLYRRYKNQHEAFGKTLAIGQELSDNRRIAEVAKGEWDCIEKLISILRSKNPIAIDAVSRNIEAFALLVSLDAKRSKR